MSVVRRGWAKLASVAGVASAVLVLNVSAAPAAPVFDVGMSNRANEVQAVNVEATTGQFRLVFGSGGAGVSETPDIPAAASAAEVQGALNALTNISAGGGSVSVVRGGFEPTTGLEPYLVTFNGGPLAARPQPLMSVAKGSALLANSPLGGVPAMAYVETREPGGVFRGDERVDYLVTIKNVASPQPVAGDVLACDAIASGAWTNSPTFIFSWTANGEPAPGPASSTATTSSYTVQPADAGKAIQCMVKGSNAGGSSMSFSPPVVVDPIPSPAPPMFPSPLSGAARPTISPTGNNTNKRTCVEPAGWSGASAGEWSYQWLRNGEPIPGATDREYQPTTAPGEPTVPGGEDQFKTLQCRINGKSGSGAPPSGGVVTAVSAHFATSPPAGFPGGAPPSNGIGAPSPEIASSAFTSSPVEAVVELPPGEDSYVFPPGTTGTNWSCTAVPAAPAQPAKAVCVNPELKAPGDAFSPLNVAMALGADAPDSSPVKVTVSGGGAATPVVASDAFSIGPLQGFGLLPGRFSARALDRNGEDFTEAGGHPTAATSSLSFTRYRRLVDEGLPYKRHEPVELVKDVKADIPPGFIGNPTAIPDLCPSVAELVQTPANCPPGSVVGELAFQAPGFGSVETGLQFRRMALYAMEPEDGVPAQFAAAESFNKAVYVLTPRLRPGDGYAISIESVGIVESPEFTDIKATLCGYGANTRLVSNGTVALFASCKDKDDPGALAKPFLTSQTECASSGPVTRMHLNSWADPNDVKTYEAKAPKMTGCELVPFEPKLALGPTANQAESASGLDVSLTVPTDGFEDPDGLSQAHLKKTTVTLPPGMSVNPSSADGLGACTQAQLGMVNGVPNNEPVNCPDASKIGTAVVKTPILEETLEGDIYLAKQGDNPFGTLVAIYVVVESKERGILIKLPGKVEFGPGGRIVSTFDDNPQAPFSSLELSFNSGPRAALMTPQRCGSYQIVSQMTPWSAADPDNPTPAETVTQTSSFDVTSGPNGGPCPTGALLPKVKAGLATPMAGASSPFVFTMSRDDGTQRFNGLTMSLPPGLAANLRGVPYCSDATLASIPSAEGTGAAEVANPSCPAASRIGSVSVGAGAGKPFYVNTGSAYLAGPYKGAPLSLAVVIPAVAGPFDLGSVVVRNAVLVNPQTAQVSIKSDPLPTQLHNLPVDVRDVRVTVDRPGFMVAPTNCEEMRIDAVISGEEGGSAPVSNRFQVGECGSLDFGPKLKLRYKGATKRGGNPGLSAVLTQPGGQANISRTVVVLPKGSFIDQAHVNNPCTRAQYAAEACPKNSILGRATAWSPLLDEPLTGNVYFRSNGGERTLPDIVASLRGQVNVELVGFVDSVVNKKANTSRVRNTFAVVPDAPVSKFELTLKGGKLGLIENSRNLCLQKNTADVKMNAHNGKRLEVKPVIQTDCKKKPKKSQKKKKSSGK